MHSDSSTFLSWWTIITKMVHSCSLQLTNWLIRPNLPLQVSLYNHTWWIVLFQEVVSHIRDKIPRHIERASAMSSTSRSPCYLQRSGSISSGVSGCLIKTVLYIPAPCKPTCCLGVSAGYMWLDGSFYMTLLMFWGYFCCEVSLMNVGECFIKSVSAFYSRLYSLLHVLLTVLMFLHPVCTLSLPVTRGAV